VKGTNRGTTSDARGDFRLKIPANDSLGLVFSCVGYKTLTKDIFSGTDMKKDIVITMEFDYEQLEAVSISAEYDRATNMMKLNTKDLKSMPGTTGAIETTLNTLPGVSARSELSTQYSVRGGNYDENLIYVNDIEIYRPLLVRSGKQEGLSFVNPDMISSIKFSAGGFEAVYGDKMSSVLDITYKKPKDFGGSVNASILGGSAHVQGASKNKKFTHISSFRYKTFEYLFGTLETKGEYNPVFTDLQTFLTYNLNPKWELSFLGNYALNKYNFIPNTRKTVFGTLQDVFSLNIYYDGQETDQYETYLGALSSSFNPNKSLNLKFISSAYRSNEEEAYDLLGQYYINEANTSVGGDHTTDSVMNIGVGSFLEHARNYLNVDVVSLAHKGRYYISGNNLKWGIKYKHEIIEDDIWEWKLLDSSGYTLPYSDSTVDLYETKIATNAVRSNRFEAFVQNSHRFLLNYGELNLITGLRSQYWDFSNELLLSPRLSVSYTPDWKQKTVFHISTGYYFQPPFYKEMRDPQGNINKNIKAQKSVHLVVGASRYFMAWDRPFKFTADAYYKDMSRLIPYKVKNVRIAYSGENEAKGFATGLDMKVNGEFVEGVESWVSLSFMRTRADISNDYFFNQQGEKIEPGYYPRPTDQLVNFGMFFQDYFPNNPSFRFSLTLKFGSGLPYSLPNSGRYDQFFRMPPYRRVDIGFSKSFETEKTFLKPFKNILISAEVFNIFDISNTISYLWVKAISDNPDVPDMFAVPNYLTRRRLNLKITANF
jgi:hypothetical protein